MKHPGLLRNKMSKLKSAHSSSLRPSSDHLRRRMRLMQVQWKKTKKRRNSTTLEWGSKVSMKQQS